MLAANCSATFVNNTHLLTAWCRQLEQRKNRLEPKAEGQNKNGYVTHW